MEFGDDDDDVWNNEADLEALEAQARNAYAASQHRAPTQQQVQDVTNVDVSALIAEKQRYEKLAQSKQGELNILKSNIARTNTEYNGAVEKLKSDNATIRADLLRQLDDYKDRIARLETDLVFQRQELKESKLQQALNNRPPGTPSPRKAKPKGNGFPDRSAFEDDGAVPRVRKRRRQQSEDDGDLDAFELAELRAKERQHSHVREDTPISIAPVSPAHTHVGDLMPEIGDLSIQNEPTLLDIHNVIISSEMETGNCLAYLMKVAYKDSTLGSLLLGLLAKGSDSASQLALEATAILVSAYTSFREQEDTVFCVYHLLHQLLFAFPSQVSKSIVVDASSNEFLTTLNYHLRLAKTDFVIRSLHILLHIVESLERDISACEAIHKSILTAWRFLLHVEQVPSIRRLTLQVLAKSAVPSGPLKNAYELLNMISRGLDDEDDYAGEKSLTRTTLQCLYSMLVTQEDGIQILRKDRQVVPRLVRRILKDADHVTQLMIPDQTVATLAMEVRLYYILLNEEGCPELEAHWRSTYFKSAHIVAMTRIAFAEDSLEIPHDVREMSRDLLELSLSPDEGDDVYEVMVGSGTADEVL